MNIKIKKIIQTLSKKSSETLREAINDAEKSNESFKTGAALIKAALKD